VSRSSSRSRSRVMKVDAIVAVSSEMKSIPTIRTIVASAT
jgi:hypothetical protein